MGERLDQEWPTMAGQETLCSYMFVKILLCHGGRFTCSNEY